ncbi:MAG TPA: DUF2779 domain-containing protein [Hyphomicrobiaceae bacterium]|nr:DUF2779 domain-containing protein [Hyphomicrobiaceae bacterium]
MPRNFSKSKLIAWRQCEKRLWLEIHKPDEAVVSPDAEARFAVGHKLNDIVRRLYDPDGTGALIDIEKEGFGPALARSTKVLEGTTPVFEAGVTASGGLAFADVMLPVTTNGKRLWRMIEVKSATSVKDYHRDDAAIQSHVFRSAGVPLASVAIAHIDSSWVYPGDGDYRGLVREGDVTEEAFARGDEVKAWIAGAAATADLPSEPPIATGPQCTDPFECGFLHYCAAKEKQPDHPVSWLPGRKSKAAAELIETKSVRDMRDIPDEYLDATQRRVKQVTLSGEPYFDHAAAAAEIAKHGTPALFLDFEAVQFAIPVWKGTRPYQQIPFQFSMHLIAADGRLYHAEFLDLTGDNPARAFAENLVEACTEPGPIFVYNQSFEKTRIRELADAFPDLSGALLAINDRIVDLLPVTRRHYYHPDQRGSWSIKSVLPTVAPELDYDSLEDVKDGTMAVNAYIEAIAPATAPDRKTRIEKALLEYCKRDTYANYVLWKVLSAGLRVLVLACMLGFGASVHAAGPVSQPADAPDLTAIKALIKARSFAAARNDLKVLAEKYEQADVFNLYAFSLRKTGDLATAETYYEKALALDPDHKGALEYQGELFIQTKRPERAQANLARLVVLCPKGCEERADLEKAMRKAKIALRPAAK